MDQKLLDPSFEIIHDQQWANQRYKDDVQAQFVPSSKAIRNASRSAALMRVKQLMEDGAIRNAYPTTTFNFYYQF